jgi:hypothetical protein
MNLENLRTKLIVAARLEVPAENLPYSFEKRVMARLTGLRSEDVWSFWARGLWKGAVACAAITAVSIVLSVWALPAAGDQADGAVFETVVLAGADELTESW